MKIAIMRLSLEYLHFEKRTSLIFNEHLIVKIRDESKL